MHAAEADAALAEPIIDIHQHTHYHGRTDEDLIKHQKTMGVTLTVLLPAGWDVSAVSQSGTIGTYQNRAFVALINLNAENSYRVTIHARRR